VPFYTDTDADTGGSTHAAFAALVRLLLAAACTGAAACRFLDETDANATILCTSNDDCNAPAVCDLVQHTCRVSPSPPRLLDIRFEPPAIHTGDVELVVSADQDLDEVTLSFRDIAVPFTLDDGEGELRTLSATADDLDEGVYALTAVELVATDGERARPELVGVNLRVDHTPPQVLSLTLVDPPIGNTYTDAAPFNEVNGLIVVSEPLAVDGASFNFGSIASTCSEDTALRFRCGAQIPIGVFNDGPIDVTTTVRDAAGNTGSASIPIIIDAAPPTVVIDSVEVAITNGGTPALAVLPVSIVTVAFVASEDLGTAPTLLLDVLGSSIDFSLVEQVGRRVVFRRVGGFPSISGAFAVHATLTDRFGHVNVDVPVPLPPPFETGLPLSVGAPSCPSPSANACVDADGDGFAATLSCVAGSDDDDSDPTVGPGFIEVPGDGRDNNQIAGDLLIDETSGVFVDSELGNDATGDGSRAAPFRHLDVAEDAAGTLGLNMLYLAERTTSYTAASGQTFGTSVVGGLDPASWTRTGGRSTIGISFCAEEGFIDSVVSDRDFGDCGNGATFYGGTIYRSALAVLRTAFGTKVVFSHIGAMESGGPSDIIDSQIDDLFAIETTTRAVRLRATNVELFYGSGLLINSVIAPNVGPAVDCFFCTSLQIIHSTLVGNASASPVFGVLPADHIFVVGNSLIAPGGNPIIDAEANTAIVVGNNFSGSGPVFQAFNLGRVYAADVSELNACNWPECLGAFGNTAFDIAANADPHLADDSLLRDIGVDALAEGAPPAVVTDVDGNCRYADGAADAGADEAPPL
jgi:hypothetical protein